VYEFLGRRRTIYPLYLFLEKFFQDIGREF